jgi:hypothetical protein
LRAQSTGRTFSSGRKLDIAAWCGANEMVMVAITMTWNR